MAFNRLSGDEVAAAIDARIQSVAQEVFTNSPANRTVYGRVVSSKLGVFSVEINSHIYENVRALRNVGTIKRNETVVCLVPNNEYSNMIIIGVADGSIVSTSGEGGGLVTSINGSTAAADIYAPLLGGTSGQFLVSQGVGSAPTWETLPLSGYVSDVSYSSSKLQQTKGGSTTDIMNLGLSTATGSESATIGANTLNLLTRDTAQTISAAKTLGAPLNVTGGDSATAGKIAISRSGAGQITDESTSTLFGFLSANATTLTVGGNSFELNLRGSATRPQYKGGDIALYSDLPTVNNPTITVTQGGVTKGSFTLNQSSAQTIALDAGGGSSTDVQINGTSITSGGVANIQTKGTYNASTNKIATESDLPPAITITTTSGSESVSDGTNTLNFGANAFNSTTIPTTTDSVTQSSTAALTSGGAYTALDGKMDKANPIGTGSLSLNRRANSTVGNNSVAVGNNTVASGNYSHAEGSLSTASGDGSHAEGVQATIASGDGSHAEGVATEASGSASHAEGCGTIASGDGSHAEGYYTTAQRKSQHVFGEYNVLDATGTISSRGNYVEIVGNGTSSSVRSNARTLDWSGNEELAGNLIAKGGKIGDGKNANYKLAIPDTTSWTADKTIATSDQIPASYVSSVNGNTGAITKVPIQSSTTTTADKVLLSTTTANSASWSSSAKGSTTKPVYLNSSGVLSEGDAYAGGTSITLNETSKAGQSVSFYAPTAVGTARKVLQSVGYASPVWVDVYPVGAVYFSTVNTSPASFFGGSWTQILSNATITLGTSFAVAGNGKTIMLTNGSSDYGLFKSYAGNRDALALCVGGAGTNVGTTTPGAPVGNPSQTVGLTTNSANSGMTASASSSLSGIYAWKRTA